MKFFVCAFCLLILIGCNSDSSESSGSVETAESSDSDSLIGRWARACSPVDDSVTSELFSDADLLPLWWKEELEVSSQGFRVVRDVYTDDSCSTPLIDNDDEPMVLACQGTDRESALAQGTYEVISLVYADSSGMPDKPDTCDLPSEPALNIYLGDKVLYRAYYEGSPTTDAPDLVVNFNKIFEPLN